MCERRGTPVTSREVTQWFFRITAYAQRLLGGRPAGQVIVRPPGLVNVVPGAGRETGDRAGSTG